MFGSQYLAIDNYVFRRDTRNRNSKQASVRRESIGIIARLHGCYKGQNAPTSQHMARFPNFHTTCLMHVIPVCFQKLNLLALADSHGENLEINPWRRKYAYMQKPYDTNGTV